MNNKSNAKGITLIALVITIIVLLILAGAAVSIGLNGGDVFNRANQAKTEWNAKVAEEDAKIKEIWDMLDTDSYTINSIEDLVAFAYNVNKGDTEYELYSGKTVVLGVDLDIQNDKSYANPNAKYVLVDYGYKPDESGTAIKTLLTDTTGIGFVPIGNGKSNGFAGIFNGRNHSIINLYENSNNYGGLFGVTNNTISISNLGIKDCNIQSNAPAGGVLGWTGTQDTTVTIQNCYTTGTVSSNSVTGGIYGGGSSNAMITNCHNKVAVTGNPAGGIVGNMNSPAVANVIDCYNTGKISSSAPAGGMIGTAGIATIRRSYNTGTVSSSSIAGGIIGGTSTITIEDSYNDGNITSTGAPAGGMIASASALATIASCHNSGNVTSSGTNGLYGTAGIIGVSKDAKIDNCYNSGIISSTNSAGGILGYTNQGTTEVNVTNCYNTGEILPNNSDSDYGGIIGRANTTTNAINCFNSGNILNDQDNIGGHIGGIIGTIYYDNGNLTAINCFNGVNLSGKYNIGGILGYSWNSTITNISNCYNVGSILSERSYAGGIIGARCI